MTAGVAIESGAPSRNVFPRIPALDGVRAVAVLAIVFHHAYQNSIPAQTTGIDHTLSQVVFVGYLSVDLFFALSGYLITAILGRSRNFESPLRTFYARRFFRIVPLYYGFLILAMLFLRWLPPEIFGTTTHAWEWLYLTNVGIAVNGLDAVGRTFGHFWTLSVEEHFYIVWPLVVLYVSRRALFWICFAIFFLSTVASLTVTSMGHYVAAYVLTPTHLYSLASGSLIAVMEMHDREALECWSRRIMWGVAAILVLYVALRFTGSPPEIISLLFPLSLFAIPAALALLVLGKGGWVRSALSTRPMRGIGKVSYGMYVFHVPMLHISLVEGWVRPTIIGGHYFIYATLFGIVLIGVSILAGTISWNVWEKQFLRFAPPYRAPAPAAQALVAAPVYT